MAPRHLIISVENVNRELDAKLLLAGCAVERGFSVVFGEKRELNERLASLPPSVFLVKDVVAKNRSVYERAARLGHRVAAIDEEALVYLSTQKYFETKVGPETLVLPERLFAWGDENASVWREHPSRPQSIETTGNPRIDMLRPELRDYWNEEAAQLRERYGRFLLINTNFALLNNLRANREFERHTLLRAERDPDSVPAFELALAQHRQRLFEAFQEAVGSLARAYPELTLVVRPHPSEEPSVWLRAAASATNACAVHEGNAAPWLLAAEAVIHNGCTTALEAWVLGRPAIAFQPVVDDRFDRQLPNSLSHRAYDVGMLQKLVDAVLDGSLHTSPGELRAQREIIEHWVSALDGPLAAERIVTVLEELSQQPPPRPGAGFAFRAGQQLRDGARRLQRSSTRLLKPSTYRGRAAYYGHVFPPQTAPELEQRIARLGRQLGRFDGIRVRPAGKNVFRIGRR